MKNLRIEKGKKYYPYASNWVVGTFENRGATYRFNAKVYPEPSIYGIKEGRVSNLWVKNLKLDKEVFNYNRGFDIGNESMCEKGMIKDLLAYLEVYAVEAMSDLWKN